MTDVMHDRVVVAVGDLYDVQGELGRGGMALVYRAIDRRLKRPVALKVLPPELAFREEVKRRFLREAETSARLNYQNIVPIYSVDEKNGIVYLVMALVDGETLAARLARAPRMNNDEVRRLLREVAGALAYAHARGVVHRDIKPENILIDRESGRAMVTDFGIARAAEGDAKLTVTGVVIGTPAYMSPEQALGEKEADGRSDIYSLGVVGYLMLTGELPFKASNTPSMMMKHLTERLRPVRELRPDAPADLAAIVEHALAKKPEDRFPSAAEMASAFASPGWHAPGSAAQSAPPAPAPSSAPPASYPYAPLQYAPPALPRAPVPLRDIVAPWAHQAAAFPIGADGMPAHPMSRREWKEWRRNYRDQMKFGIDGRPLKTIGERIVHFRRHVVTTISVIGMLGGINLLTNPRFPWFLFPAIFMTVGLIKDWGSLWSEGVTLGQILSRPSAPDLASLGSAGNRGEVRALPPAVAEDEAAKLAPREVLAGAYGANVRRAVADRAAVLATVNSLAKADRDLLPDVVPTVTALVERVASVAQTLHHLDADCSPALVKELEARIAQVEREPADASDRERRLSLLKRQLISMTELGSRRARLTGQLDSAGLALQNLKYDLLKLRSSGVQSAIGDVNSATVEARALSREIGHVLEAADELRKIDV
ncbi:MAG TPA: protein kinase [Gemmatimonadaceae bacterium]|nr:protein kinase [Gemmatimonadaceae bacterium]